MLAFRSNLPAEVEEATVSHDSRTENTGNGELELAFAPCLRKEAPSNPPNGLVVSSDDEVSRKLAESLGQCGLAPIFASTVVESRMALAAREVFLVLCNECLADGTYEDIVNLVRRSHTRIPLVVVSRIGEWPEYFRAVGCGAFDYLAYPPIRGELQRVIRDALLGCKRQRHLEGA
jgi:DNA-binding NtrC family response regulator